MPGLLTTLVVFVKVTHRYVDGGNQRERRCGANTDQVSMTGAVRQVAKQTVRRTDTNTYYLDLHWLQSESLERTEQTLR